MIDLFLPPKIVPVVAAKTHGADDEADKQLRLKNRLRKNYLARREEILRKRKEHYAQNKKKVLKKSARWQAKNRARKNEINRRYRLRKKVEALGANHV